MRVIEHPPRTVAKARPHQPLHIAILATHADGAAVLSALPPSRHLFTIAPHGSTAAAADVALVVTDASADIVPLPAGRAWVAWNPSNQDAVALAAYRQGASFVVSGPLDGPALLAAIERAGTRADPGKPRSSPGLKRYIAQARIALGEQQVLRVESGIVAQRVIHADGTDVLIGLFGPRQLIVGHPDDGCCLDLIAHTDAEALCLTWDEAVRTPGFPDALRLRLQQMEGWAAAQARTHLDARLLGVLGVLAEQFGKPCPQGLVVDVKLTHDLLASATAATRATVTRALGRLRHRGLVRTVDTVTGRRYCLDSARAHGHAH
jgi:CRP-like cAMP-binding protein